MRTAHAGLYTNLRRRGSQRSAPEIRPASQISESLNSGQRPGNTDWHISVSIHDAVRPHRRGLADLNCASRQQLQADFEEIVWFQNALETT